MASITTQELHRPLPGSDGEESTQVAASRPTWRRRAKVACGLLGFVGATAAAAVWLQPRQGPARGASERLVVQAEEEADSDGKKVYWNHVGGDFNVPWVMSWPGENCKSACERSNLLCREAEDYWPRSKEVLQKITKELGYDCKNWTVAESTFDPSASTHYCSYGTYKPSNVWGEWKGQKVRSCKANPPLSSVRFCMCELQSQKDARGKCTSTCDGTCDERGDCCPTEEDECAEDPFLKKWPDMKKDPKWWGSALATEDQGVPADAWCQENAPKEWKAPPVHKFKPQGSVNMKINVLSYNLQWWKLFEREGGGAAPELIRSSGQKDAYDVMGFQECEDIEKVLTMAKLSDDYASFDAKHALCIAYRKALWELIDHGEDEVAEDGSWVWKNYWSKRTAVWMRLKHKDTGKTLFFMDHHGPIPINSGGLCGGANTAYNLLSVISSNAKDGDAIIFVGDFNANGTSLTTSYLRESYNVAWSGGSFEGVDHIFTNVDLEDVLFAQTMGQGGSDHDAIKLQLQLKR